MGATPRGAPLGERPRSIAHGRLSIGLAGGAPYFRGRVPMVAYDDAGAIRTARVR